MKLEEWKQIPLFNFVKILLTKLKRKNCTEKLLRNFSRGQIFTLFQTENIKKQERSYKKRDLSKFVKMKD